MPNEAHNNAGSRELFDRSLWEHAANPAAGMAEAVAQGLKCDEVHVTFDSPSLGRQGLGRTSAKYTSFRDHATPSGDDPLISITKDGLTYRGTVIPSPVVVNDLTRARLPGDLSVMLSTLGVRSFGAFPLKRRGVVVGVVSCFFKKHFHRWRSDEISALEKLGEAVPLGQANSDGDVRIGTATDVSLERYQRLATRGNIIILTTDRDFAVMDVFGNSEQLLGVSAEKLKGDPAVWSSIVEPRDAARLVRRIARMKAQQSELQEEVRVVHKATGQVRWIHLRALPYRNQSGEVVGWEGFGVDVTERHEAKDALLRQNARLQAVFEISRSLGELRDPAVVTLTGLRSVLGATRSECGYAVFREPDTGSLEVVAAVGLSEEYLTNIDQVLEGPSLLRTAIDTHTRYLIPDLQKDARAARPLAELERIRAAIVIPLMFESVVYGGLVLFKRTADSYDTDDFELAVSAASQMTLAIRQAEMLEVQRRQSASLGSLYTVSRELAKYRATVDFADQILPTLRNEFALKSCWLGLLNEQQTYLIGRAGFGPGMEADTISTQIEISEQQVILKEVLQGGTPVVLDDPSEEEPEAILDLFAQPSSLVIVPMVTIGHVMGVLVLEPLSKQTFCSGERLQLLVSMANEIATAMMSGRFESKMANAVKMRTAGLLASGVAHNFNNILQAIMGQVSLIQLESKGSQVIHRAAHTIQEASMRGASLVSQLLRFATKGASSRVPMDVASLLGDSRTLYESLLGKEIALAIDDQTPRGTAVFVDPSQLQQVITSMLANSKDALVGANDGEVTISAHSVVVRSTELAADLAPGPYVRIDVRDNGVGMSQEGQARCFEPFFTTKNVDKDTGVGLSGSGLGLAAAYAIIKGHNGVITVHSKEGDGAIFSVYLPSSAEARHGRADSPPEAQGNPKGVLLLGIESGVQPFIASAFESLGYTARGVFDSRQAEQLLTQQANEWGIVLVDGEGLNGSQRSVCENLVARFPHLFVICLKPALAPSVDPAIGDSQAERRVHFLAKPVTGWELEVVMQRINESLRGTIGTK